MRFKDFLLEDEFKTREDITYMLDRLIKRRVSIQSTLKMLTHHHIPFKIFRDEDYGHWMISAGPDNDISIFSIDYTDHELTEVETKPSFLQRKMYYES